MVGVVDYVCVAVVDDLEGVAGAGDEGGAGGPDVISYVLDAGCAHRSAISFLCLVSWGEIWGLGIWDKGKGEGELTGNCGDGVQCICISLSQDQGHGICGSGGGRPGDVEGCASGDGCECREGEGVLCCC